MNDHEHPHDNDNIGLLNYRNVAPVVGIASVLRYGGCTLFH